ncbi:MAG: DnaD domain protein [Ruminococcaceae bacterium]|nr:DnaD domain protein [Oscillospiraceae bacterium]
MNSLINPEVFTETFSFPAAAVDKCIKLASATQLKVLLFIFRFCADELSTDEIAEKLSIDISEVNDAIGFWSSMGILKGNSVVIASDTKKARIQSEKPTREEIARMGATDEKLQFLLREAQNCFARPLRQSETSLLAWLYKDEGMDVSVILMLLKFAVKEEKVSLRFIESTAISWIDDGVETIADAEAKMQEALIYDQCFKLVAAAFGITKRKPSKKEAELSVLWVKEWKFDRKILEKAYETCIDTISEFSFPYIKKILEKWHNDGVKTVDDIKEEKPKNQENNNEYADYINSIMNKEDE